MAVIYSPEKEFHLQITSKDIGKYVILPGDPGRCEMIAAFFDEAHFVHTNREYTIYTGSINQETVSVCSTGIGGPSAVIALEELVHCGAHTFIRIGTSGGMAPEVLGGDAVVASAAVRMEGTSREYAPIEYPAAADFDTVCALRQAALDNGLKVHVGVVQSKDSFYGQHEPDSMPAAYELKNKWDAYIKCGALCSEMETAALYIAGAVRRVRVGSMLMVLANQTRREMGLDDPQRYEKERPVKAVVDAMRILVEQDRKRG